MSTIGGDGTIEAPYTHRIDDDGAHARYRYCQCRKCGVISKCTPMSDYFGMRGQPLLCSHCCGPYGQNSLPVEVRP